MPHVVRVIVTCLTFAVLNMTLVLVAAVIMYREPARTILDEMRPALPGYLAFGALGAVVGELYGGLGPLAVVLLLTPIVIARATFNNVLELGRAHDATIRVFVRAIAAKDEYTAKHTERVCKYSMYIGERLGLSHTRLEHLRRAALMHDIGKLAVPKHLLNKPGKLTDSEFQRVQKHAHVCIDILDLVDFLKPMTAAAAGHHARYDGGGYGGTGERPLEAYIVAVADAYDAMTSTRSYRRALPMEVAFEELRAKSGSQFHPDCVEALINAITERGERHGFGHETDAVAFDVPPPVAGVGSAGLGDRAAPAVAPAVSG
jgi:HD-GYP domain-containing protein (c-di-GMP phosphodiesterase class II)